MHGPHCAPRTIIWIKTSANTRHDSLSVWCTRPSATLDYSSRFVGRCVCAAPAAVALPLMLLLSLISALWTRFTIALIANQVTWSRAQSAWANIGAQKLLMNRFSVSILVECQILVWFGRVLVPRTYVYMFFFCFLLENCVFFPTPDVEYKCAGSTRLLCFGFV